MFSSMYNLVLFCLGVIALPKILWQMAMQGKYRSSFASRLGFKLPPAPPPSCDPIIWIHAVSFGETRAVLPLYKIIREKWPHARLIVSSITETGHKEAKRSLPDAHAHFFLPLDFSWIMRKVVAHFRPDLLLLVEGEFWYHLLSETKKSGAHIALVNGKLSERSLARFTKIPSFAKKLFAHIDLFCLQSEIPEQRFKQLGIQADKMTITGNLKLDLTASLPPRHQIDQLRTELGITPDDRVIVLGSTHTGEEELLIQALMTLSQKHPEWRLKTILVPRHPERFSTVAKSLASQNISFFNYSQKEHKTGKESVIVIDAMGLLQRCYGLAEIAIVGGSFVTGIGGHNIFEPVSCGVPVLFGPYMPDQMELRGLVLKAQAGIEVTADTLSPTLTDLLQNNTSLSFRKEMAQKAAAQAHGVAEKTLHALFPFTLNRK